jgi:hypothetical protein
MLSAFHFYQVKTQHLEPGVVVHTCNPTIQEVEAGAHGLLEPWENVCETSFDKTVSKFLHLVFVFVIGEFSLKFFLLMLAMRIEFGQEPLE